MRGVLERVSADTAGRIRDSANPSEIRVLQRRRENTASMTREHKFLGGNRGNLRVEKFRLNSSPPVRERLQGIAEGASSAPRLAS